MPFLLAGPNVVRDVNDLGRKEEPTLEYWIAVMQCDM